MRKTDVIIVGYGPTAAVAANILGSLGWQVDVFERSAGVYFLPRAVHFDDEVMRLFQQLGIAEQVEPLTQPVLGMDLVNAAGTTLASYVATESVSSLGWKQGYMFHQPELEQTLRAAVSRFPNVRIHLEHEVLSVKSQAQGAVVQVRSQKGEKDIHAAMVLGCCGAHSITRDAVGGLPFDYGAHQPWIVVDVQLLRDTRLAPATVQYCDPARPSTSIPTPGSTRRFELMLMPGETADQMTSTERIAELLSPWLEPADYRVQRAAVYTFHALVAQRWRQQSLMIAGDAAHLMPPFLGQGLGSGARDVANLCWKIDLVLRGIAHESLLDTYQEEREPHVRALIESDMWLAGIIQSTDQEFARQRDAQMVADPAAATLVPPSPGLGGDLCGSGPADRRPFPQPLIKGKMHDEHLGNGFTLLGNIAPSAWACKVLQLLDTHIETTTCAEITQWMHDKGAIAVVVRPDRYVLATVADANALDIALAPLARHLCMPQI
jgi:3-(3-hydroxy-phenyl)propionate hydroxylase